MAGPIVVGEMLKSALLLILMPPVNLVLLGLAGVVLARFRPRIGWGITLASLLGLLVLSMHGVTSPMLSALERDLPTVPAPDAPPGAIIILAGDSMASLSVPNGHTVGALTLQRLRTGAELHRRSGLPLLVSGGSVPAQSPTLADLMTVSLRQDFRVDVRWQERRSRDTWENARFSADILLPAGITSVYVVTHAWHMRRALLAFEGTGLRVTAAPTPLLRPIHPSITDFIPSVGSLATAYFAVHEWVGLLWYSWRH